MWIEMQMDLMADIKYVIVTGEENYVVGIVIYQKGCTLADICHEIMDDELIEYPFDFIVDFDIL